MKALLKKEFRLALHPTQLIFLALSAMLIIPNYPYYVAFFYTCLGVFFTCLTGRENQDIQYTLLLPVRKRDIVSARVGMAVIMQLVQGIIALPFMFIRRGLPVPPNQVGMEANLAMLGIGFVLFGLFNMVFFGIYYKNPQKVGKAFVIGAIVVFAGMMVAEVLAHFPVISTYLDNFESKYLVYRLITLILGLVIYAVLTLLTLKRGQRNFEKYDLA